MFWGILGIILNAIFFGWICYKMADIKGYDDGWRFTMLGVFLSVLGLIIVACLPDLEVREKLDSMYKKLYHIENQSNEGNESQEGDNNSLLDRYAKRAKETETKVNASMNKQPSWTCIKCGAINASYVGTCGCGAKKT